MDFAKLMQSQIAASTPSKDATDNKTKYLKRSEIEAQRQAEYAREHAQRESERAARTEKKRKHEEEEAERREAQEAKRVRLAEEGRRLEEEERRAEERAQRKRLGLPDLDESKHGENDEEESKDDLSQLSDEEISTRLRDLGEPLSLSSDETPAQRLARLRALTTPKAMPIKMTNGPIPTSLTLLPEAEMRVPSSLPKSPEERALLRRQLASYFDLVLREWQKALARRSEEVRDSFAGRQALATYELARSNLVPLFRKLESNAADAPAKDQAEKLSDDARVLSPTVLAAVQEIANLAQQRRYVAANDAYLRLSIGNAAWPIGVTMVGIHARSAREKLHAADGGGKAHILSDETTRKLLQGIKRCLSFAQTRWPPDDAGQIMG